MKKALIMIFTVLLVFSLASCGGKSTPQNTASSSAKSSNEGSGQKKLLSNSYADIMKSGKFLIRYKTTIVDESGKTDAEITTAVNGKNVAAIIKTNGLTTHTIFKDNVLYFLDDANKTYSKMNAGQNGQSSKTGNFDDTEGLRYIGSGTSSVSGRTLPYEEYSANNDITLRFFMDGKKLYAITSKSENSQTEMVVLELIGNIPAGMISIPADYKESTAMTIPSNISASDTEQTE